MPPSQTHPTILFGAFDRHNFGDLLLPHVVARLLRADKLIYAGLAERDLRPYGGHRVRSLARLAAAFGSKPVDIIHVGGEVLTCDAWQAAVMLLPAERVQQTIRRLETDPDARSAWARETLGLASLAPYTVPRRLFPAAPGVIYNAVGGVELAAREPAFRAEVVAKLSAAAAVGVRDSQTRAILEELGVAARLLPDPAVMVATLFGDRIGRRVALGETSEMLRAFPRGYIAVQFSADFGDDETLTEIARQLDQCATSSRLAVVFFRAGAAPWHDDLDCYRRTASRMRTHSIRIFASLDIWDICALISRCRVYCGSSLHGRIVAGAYALPGLNLVHPSQAGVTTKQAAYGATWESPDTPATAEISDLAQGIGGALAADPRRRQELAREMTERYTTGFDGLRDTLADLERPYT